MCLLVDSSKRNYELRDEESMDPASVVKWGQKQGGPLELCMGIKIPGSEWTEREVHKLVKYLIDMRTEFFMNCTCVLLEWKGAILVSKGTA